MTTRKTQRVPSLEQYAYASLPLNTKVPTQVLRTLITKRTIDPIKKQQLTQKMKTILKPITSGAPPTKKEIIEFESMIKINLKIYLEKNPAVPLNILSNFFGLFNHGLLTTRKLLKFTFSSIPFTILDNYIGGDENVCLLFKYARKTYLIVLNETYPDFYRNVPDELYQKYQQRMVQGQATIEAFVRHHPPNIQIKYAVPITISENTNLPVPFQQQTTTSLCNRV